MATPRDNLINSMHETFLLVVIAFVAFALIAAAHGAYTTGACHPRDQASDIQSGHETVMGDAASAGQ
jgi:hypothetical protein